MVVARRWWREKKAVVWWVQKFQFCLLRRTREMSRNNTHRLNTGTTHSAWFRWSIFCYMYCLREKNRLKMIKETRLVFPGGSSMSPSRQVWAFSEPHGIKMVRTWPTFMVLVFSVGSWFHGTNGNCWVGLGVGHKNPGPVGCWAYC